MALSLVRRTAVLLAEALFTAAVLSATAAPTHADEPGQHLSAERLNQRVLVDSLHANNYLSCGLSPDEYSYHRAQGPRLAFEYLKAQGVAVDEMSSGRIDAARLKPYGMLFLNLVSAERPPFLVSEIVAIRDYVAGGGSLLVISDHSNCYFHSHRLAPLLAEMGIESFTDTACDVPPHTIGSGNGWLSITRFADHPVTRGLRRLGIQTGGRVDERYAVAFTSDAAWADRWATSDYGEENAPGFYGDFRYGDGEVQKSLGVVLAREFGRGRIVIVADQNLLGDPFLHYADNYRLWINAAAWLLQNESLADPGAYLSRRDRRVTFFEQRGEALIGSSDNDGYLNAFHWVARRHWTFASDRSEDFGSLLVLAHGDVKISAEQAGQIARQLKDGASVLVLGMYGGELRETGTATAAILAAAESLGVVCSENGDRLEASIGGRGRVVALREPGEFQNALLNSVTERPNQQQQARGEALLRHIGDCLESLQPPAP